MRDGRPQSSRVVRASLGCLCHVKHNRSAAFERTGIGLVRGSVLKEDAVSRTDGVLTIPEGIPGDADTRSGIPEMAAHATVGHAIYAAPPVAAPLSVLSTCVTKQTKDLRSRDVEPLLFLSFGLTHDDGVCPGKRVVSWINACNFCRATKRRRCQFPISAVSSEYHGPLDIGESTVTKRSAQRVF